MKTKISIFGCLITGAMVTIFLSCNKSDKVVPGASTQSSAHRFSQDLPDPNAGLADGAYTWDGDVNNLACHLPAGNCIIVTIHPKSIALYNGFTDSLARGSAGVSNFFNSSTLTNGLFPFFTASGADSATTKTLANLQSGVFIMAPAAQDSTWATYAAGVAGNLSSYLIETKLP